MTALSLKVKTAMNRFRKYWPHLLLWFAMMVYFIFAPGWFDRALIKTGKPLQTENTLPSESKRIRFVVEALDLFPEGGAAVYRLSGWGYIPPEPGKTMDGFIPEIALVSDKEKYFYEVKTGYRNPGPESMFADKGVKLDTLGYEALIAGNAIRPGKYRIAIIFKNPSTGEAYYRDKPVHYLIKTPNTLTLE